MTEAAAAAADADATVVILGNWWGTTTGWPLCSGDGTDGCESESHDRTVIELPGQQVQYMPLHASARLCTPLQACAYLY